MVKGWIPFKIRFKFRQAETCFKGICFVVKNRTENLSYFPKFFFKIIPKIGVNSTMGLKQTVRKIEVFKNG